MYGNPLDSLPDDLGALSNLRLLHLEGTGLAKVPSTLVDLPSDSLVLNVRGNHLCGGQGASLETWLSKVLGPSWNTVQPQACP